MEQLKRWADYARILSAYFPPSLSAREFQGAGRQAEATRLSQSCARLKERAPNPNQKSRWKPKWMKTVGLKYRPVPIQLGVVT